MKRRGFTLIELMVVIAIIIILAAIAIPNYLTMTARAKRSRVASDFAAIATALETYRTDWGFYPEITTRGSIIGQNGSGKGASLGVLGQELAGPGTLKNLSPNVTAAGDAAPIQYMTTSILESMVNPYSNAANDEYTYIGASDGSTWTLEAPTKDTTTGKQFLMRTSVTPTVVDSAT